MEKYLIVLLYYCLEKNATIISNVVFGMGHRIPGLGEMRMKVIHWLPNTSHPSWHTFKKRARVYLHLGISKSLDLRWARAYTFPESVLVDCGIAGPCQHRACGAGSFPALDLLCSGPVSRPLSQCY